MSEAKEEMKDKEKKYYKIGEVSAMLDLPVPTLRYWENEFEQLEPFRTPKGTRKYRLEDVEMCKLIKHLLRDKGYSLKYAKIKLSEYLSTGELNIKERTFTCNSSKDALRLLSELKIKCEGDNFAVARIEAVEGWIKQTDSQS